MENFSERVSYEVNITSDDDGSLFATVSELPGLFASGSDMDELQESLAEAIGIYLSTPETMFKMNLETIELHEQKQSQTFVLVS